MSPRAAQKKHLPAQKGAMAGGMHACQSYLFTKSGKASRLISQPRFFRCDGNGADFSLFTGTIFVEGFSQGIGEDGIQQQPVKAPASDVDAAAKAVLLDDLSQGTARSGPGMTAGAAAGLVGPSGSNKGKRARFPITERLVLVCNLGFGASGVVYKALDLQTMRLVAVKMISFFDRCVHSSRSCMPAYFGWINVISIE
jgi:hypothetical protein